MSNNWLSKMDMWNLIHILLNGSHTINLLIILNIEIGSNATCHHRMDIKNEHVS